MIVTDLSNPHDTIYRVEIFSFLFLMIFLSHFMTGWCFVYVLIRRSNIQFERFRVNRGVQLGCLFVFEMGFCLFGLNRCFNIMGVSIVICFCQTFDCSLS